VDTFLKDLLSLPYGLLYPNGDFSLDTFLEYILLLLAIACVVRELFFNSIVSTPHTAIQMIQSTALYEEQQAQNGQQPTNARNEHPLIEAWNTHLQAAHQENMLGPLRLEDRNGCLCVVGMGQCHRVRNISEGLEMIDSAKKKISRLVENA